MKTRAAITYSTGEPWALDKQLWRIEELDIAPLRPDDVLVQLPYSGVCHTDLHPVTGELTPTILPMVGGHEGAGIVQDVGANITHVEPGDHVILSIVPACGVCRFCRMGRPTLCDMALFALGGLHPDREIRYRTAVGQPAGQWAMLGTFSEYVVANRNAVVKIDDDIPFDVASIVACAVTTGLGAAIDQAKVHAGDNVVIWGCGGVGMAAVQGAAIAGAGEIIAVDTNDFKLQKARQLGATVTLNANRDGIRNQDRDPIAEAIFDVTNGDGADSALLCVGNITPALVGSAFDSLRRGGRLVLVGAAHQNSKSINVAALDIATTEKEIVGCVYGSGHPTLDLPRNLKMYKNGALKLDDMLSARYPLERVNDAFDDLVQGRILKGLLEF